MIFDLHFWALRDQILEFHNFCIYRAIQKFEILSSIQIIPEDFNWIYIWQHSVKLFFIGWKITEILNSELEMNEEDWIKQLRKIRAGMDKSDEKIRRQAITDLQDKFYKWHTISWKKSTNLNKSSKMYVTQKTIASNSIYWTLNNMNSIWGIIEDNRFDSMVDIRKLLDKEIPF